MAIVASNNLETGDLTGFSATTGSGDLSVGAAGAMAYTANGMSVLIDDTDEHSGHLSLAGISNEIGFRFYFDPNTYTNVAWSDGILARFVLSNAPWRAIEVQYGRNPAGPLRYIRLRMYTDAGGTSDTSWYAITDAPHWIEIYAKRSTGAGDNNGEGTLYIDSVAKETESGIDNYDAWALKATLRFGIYAVTASTGGTVFIDEIVVRDDAQLIGPRVVGYYYQRQQ